MDRKLLIGGIVAAVVVIGGVAYAVSQTGPATAPTGTPVIAPKSQMDTEIPRGENGTTRIVPKMPDGKPLPM